MADPLRRVACAPTAPTRYWSSHPRGRDRVNGNDLATDPSGLAAVPVQRRNPDLNVNVKVMLGFQAE